MDRPTTPFPLVRIRIEDHKIVVLGTEGIEELAQRNGTTPNLLGLSPDQLAGKNLHAFLIHVIAASRPKGREELQIGHQCFPTFCKVTEAFEDGSTGIEAKVVWKNQGVPYPELSVYFNPKMQEKSSRLLIKPAEGFKCRWCQQYFLLEEGELSGQLTSCEFCDDIVQRARAEYKEVLRQELISEMGTQVEVPPSITKRSKSRNGHSAPETVENTKVAVPAG